MPAVESVLEDLKSKGKPNFVVIYVKHGVPAERTFGVSNADLKVIAKAIKGQQELALELYKTGNMDAMYLGGLVASGAKMSRTDVDFWAKNSGDMPIIADHSVAWVAVEHPDGRELALEWMASPEEYVAVAGWRTYAGLVTIKPDSELDLAEIERLLAKVEKEIHGAKNRVMSAMNGFIIAVGSYVAPLAEAAKDAANRIGAVSVDVGDTACKVPLAIEYIAKVEASGKAGVKKKTIRC